MKAFISVLALACASLMSGATIGPNCPTCQGGLYTVTHDLISATGPTDTYNIYLTIDTTGYTGGGTHINAVAVKPASQIVSFSTVGAPSGTWIPSAGGVNANGCSGSGSGFVCLQSTGLGAPVSNGTNTWIWQVVVNNGNLFSDGDEGSVKSLYVDLGMRKVGDIVSEPIPLGSEVPEPSTMLLSIAGLGCIAIPKLRRTPSRP